ncbi:conserved hypothetical protein [Vibrio nigripulchritudo MADA3029]|uniref:DUF3850 domain-containing protein n=1 Tax=Vibrio nigripulchritudo TaxID=28173 RepID=UPI0003B22555|nr:DUF3850 domain-containing protein [Vibrio nigripulchritudo]CCN48926.1 conserved hypothetical protein [Vibrio nigripulchritudo MADA3020]CCN53212.1 conserved hypothetical protein [Vibrio nigripulchritudo MADA3021]CCN56814.1 conserved hypothetical protein [Vibrio nigripulchritudo MADA3029]
MATVSRPWKVHELKIQPEFLKAIIEEKKTFEIRKNDRDFKVGDRAKLSDGSQFVVVRIKYITDFEQKDGYVVFSFDWIGGGVCQ